MSACAEPGCTGKIADGFCNLCGMASGGPLAITASSLTEDTLVDLSVPPGAGEAQPSAGSHGSKSTRAARLLSSRSGKRGARAARSRPLARPSLLPIEPLAALIPSVAPAHKRFCSSCEAPLQHDEGFCSRCGKEYSFFATLLPGDIVADKYEIKGTLAFGGRGFIYLARDTVLSRWVVLKCMLTEKDPKRLEAAVRERAFLTALKHPNVVGIHDFITHHREVFIVMEYIRGKTVSALRKERGGPLPVAEAISYILEALPALDYLDSMGLIHCDFKPENMMVEEETVKLIDMGAVRRVDDAAGDIHGSTGYTAPEAHESPTPVSDLYSAARALAVLVASFEFQGEYEYSLPPKEACPVFNEHEALYRFLQKATRQKPEERFQTATEMADQLMGVLRSVVGGGADLVPPENALFAPDSDRRSDLDERGRHAEGVPRLNLDREDPAAAVIFAAGAVASADERWSLFQRALDEFPGSVELKLRIIDELVTLERFEEAEVGMAEIESASPGDVRVAWIRGRALLAQGKTAEALAAFQALADDLPGELAPRQALGIAYEASGDLDQAIRSYEAVCRADPSLTSAALRLAWCLAQKGFRGDAVDAYRRVPSSSSHYARAQMAIARILLTPPAGQKLSSVEDLAAASAALETLDGLADGIEAHHLRADLLASAAQASAALGAKARTVQILKLPLEEATLRLAAEAEYRLCAREARTEEERIHFVDQANLVRPRTWV